jgi:hypothetical protein
MFKNSVSIGTNNRGRGFPSTQVRHQRRHQRNALAENGSLALLCFNSGVKKELIPISD